MEETVYPLSTEESSKSRVSFTKSLTYSLEEAALIGGNGASLKYPDVEEGITARGTGGEARGHPLEAQEPPNGDEKGKERQEDIEDMEAAMARKRSAEVDSDTLIEAAEEVVGSKKRMVEVKVRDSSLLFADADSDILLEAVEISHGRKKKSESVFFKDSDEEAERFLVETGEAISPLGAKARLSGYTDNILSRVKVGVRDVPLPRPKVTHAGPWLPSAGPVAVPAKEAGPQS